MLFGDVAGEVGHDRAVSGQFSGCLGESDEGGEIDLNVDEPAVVDPTTGVVAFEEVQELSLIHI